MIVRDVAATSRLPSASTAAAKFVGSQPRLFRRTLNRRCWWDEQGVRRCQGLPVGAIVAIALTIVLIVSIALTLMCWNRGKRICCGSRRASHGSARALAQRSSGTKTRSELQDDIESNASIAGEGDLTRQGGLQPLMVEDHTLPRLPTLLYSSNSHSRAHDSLQAPTERSDMDRTHHDLEPSPVPPSVPQTVAQSQGEETRRSSHRTSLSRNSMASQSSKRQSHRLSGFSAPATATAPPPMRGWPAGLIAASSRPHSGGHGREQHRESTRARRSASSSRRSSTTHAALPASCAPPKARASNADPATKGRTKVSASMSLPTSPEMSRRSLDEGQMT